MKMNKSVRAWALWVGLSACASSGEKPKSETPRATDTPAEANAGATVEGVRDAPSSIDTREVRYSAGGADMVGFVAYPAGDASGLPGVLVVHEWWGLNDYARSRAEKLAAQGYVAMAIDMFGGGKTTTHPSDAKKFAAEAMANEDAAAARFLAAAQVLKDDPRTDPNELAAIGYCFGGGVVLAMARRGAELDLVASFHGSLGAKQPLAPGVFEGQIFVATGAADPFVPAEQVTAFEAEMKQANARYELVSYEGAKHGFTNPGATALGEANQLPLAYDAAADEASWNRLLSLLSEAFGA